MQKLFLSWMLGIVALSCWADNFLLAQGRMKPGTFVPPAVKPHRADNSSKSEMSRSGLGEMSKMRTDSSGRVFTPPMPFPASPPHVEELIEQGESQTTPFSGLTLESLLSLATQNNPTLIQAQQQINGEFGKAIEAGLYPNPVISYMGEQIFVNSNTRKNTPGEFQGGIIQQEFVTAGKLRLSREKYLQRAKVTEFQAVAQQWRVCNDVRIHFWKALGERKIIDVRRELAKAAEDSSVTTREQYNLGQATRSDLHMSNVHLQRARMNLLNAENRYQRQFRELTSIVGMELGFEPLAGDLEATEAEPLDFDVMLGRLYRESPQMLAARAKYKSDQITVARERVQPIPNIVVRGGVGHNYEASDTVGMAQVSISVPIFDRNQGTIRQAEADLARQGAEIRRIELNLRSDLAKHFQDYLIARQNAIQYRDFMLPDAKAAYAEQLEAYRQNRQDWTDVLMIQKEYYQLREEYVQYLINWRTNEVLIQGYLLHGGLKAAPNSTPAGHIDSIAKPR